jgi:mycofactocin precursor
MVEPTTPAAPLPVPVQDASSPPAPGPVDDRDRPTPLVEADLLVEDVSIDGMCGVY